MNNWYWINLSWKFKIQVLGTRSLQVSTYGSSAKLSFQRMNLVNFNGWLKWNSKGFQTQKLERCSIRYEYSRCQQLFSGWLASHINRMHHIFHIKFSINSVWIPVWKICWFMMWIQHDLLLYQSLINNWKLNNECFEFKFKHIHSTFKANYFFFFQITKHFMCYWVFLLSLQNCAQLHPQMSVSSNLFNTTRLKWLAELSVNQPKCILNVVWKWSQKKRINSFWIFQKRLRFCFQW